MPRTGESFAKRMDIAKIDEDQRLVFGWFSEISKEGSATFDADGDWITEQDLEKTAYDFVLEARVAGEKHLRKGDVKKGPKVVGRLIESMMFTKAKQEQLGIDLGKVAWWGGFRIDDDPAWRA